MIESTISLVMLTGTMDQSIRSGDGLEPNGHQR